MAEIEDLAAEWRMGRQNLWPLEYFLPGMERKLPKEDAGQMDGRTKNEKENSNYISGNIRDGRLMGMWGRLFYGS